MSDAGMRATVRQIAKRGSEAWDGYPPDRTLLGYHWLQTGRGELVPHRYMPKAGQFPGGWERCGQSQLWSEGAVAKSGWRYVSPIDWPQYRWQPKPRVRVRAPSHVAPHPSVAENEG